MFGILAFAIATQAFITIYITYCHECDDLVSEVVSLEENMCLSQPSVSDLENADKYDVRMYEKEAVLRGKELIDNVESLRRMKNGMIPSFLLLLIIPIVLCYCLPDYFDFYVFGFSGFIPCVVGVLCAITVSAITSWISYILYNRFSINCGNMKLLYVTKSLSYKTEAEFQKSFSKWYKNGDLSEQEGVRTGKYVISETRALKNFVINSIYIYVNCLTVQFSHRWAAEKCWWFVGLMTTIISLVVMK